MIAQQVEQLVGNTPMLRLPQEKGQAEIYIKLEKQNPGGSVKDRVALFMINDGEKRGLLPPGGTIIEPTSGSTGIGLAMIGKARGYRVIIVMPDSMSKERRDLIQGYGAELLLTPGSQGMSGAVEKAQQLAKENGWFLPDQFGNPANVQAHVEATGPEIWKDMAGDFDAFVAGVGTGGTLSGVATFLKSQGSHARIVAVQPGASPLLTGGQAGPHAIQGIGANFIPAILKRELIDEVISVGDEEAVDATRELSKTYGLLLGISSGAAYVAAKKLAQELGEGKRIVMIAPDTGERYLSVL